MKEYVTIQVRMADGHSYEGDLFLTGRPRLKDVLNDNHIFISLKNARDEHGVSYPFVILSKQQMITVLPRSSNPEAEGSVSL